jgi:hypothetical protein
MIKLLMTLFILAFTVQAEIGFGWLGNNKQLSLEFKSKKNPWSIAVSGIVDRGELPTFQSNYYSTFEGNEFNLNASSQVYFIRHIKLYSSKSSNFSIETSPFVSVGYTYSKSEVIGNQYYADPKDGSSSHTERLSFSHTSNIDIGFRPEFLIYKRLSLLFFFGASGHYTYEMLSDNPERYNKRYSVHFFGDMVNSNYYGAAILSSFSVMYWFGTSK